LPFCVLISPKRYIFIPVLILTMTSLSQYIPFLYFGNWDAPIPQVNAWFLFSAVIVSILFIGGDYFYKQKK
jgi:hypothetical protein